MSRNLAIFGVCLAMLCGCTAGLPTFWKSPATLSAQKWRQRAETLEKQGELQQALLALRTAAHLSPEDPELPQSIRSLEGTIGDAVRVHFKNGLAQYQAGNFVQSRREFLTVLRLSPGHQRALYYLKVRLNSMDQQVYIVQRGDSFTKIAADQYKDPSKAYTIAAFNDMDPDKPLLIDTVLLLPVLTPEQLLPRKDLAGLLQQAQNALDRKQFDEVLAICEKIRMENPDNSRIRSLADAGRLGAGKLLLEKKDYFAALDQLRRVSPGYADREKAIRNVRRHIRRQAVEKKIRTARKRLNRHDYDGAITICEEILAGEPENAGANALLRESRYQLGKQLLDQGREALAIEKLSALGPDYEDAAQLLVLARARMNARAEGFYRKGVRYFLNEDLEKAIECWKKALALNPGHPKAGQDMQNAMRLLDKWRGLAGGTDPKAGAGP